jgi:transcription initiation factor TFIIB
MKGLEKCTMCETETRLVTDVESAEMICSNCGTVVAPISSDSISVSGRLPGKLNLGSMGVSTQVGKSKKDSSGQLIETNIHNTMKRLRTWDNRIQVRGHSLRNYQTAYTLLNKLKDKLNLTYAIIENAAQIYKKAQLDGIVRGRTISSSVAASLYMACRQAFVSRTLEEIAQAANVKRKLVAREYRAIVFRLELKIPRIDYYHCIEKIGARLSVPEKILRQAMRVIEKIVNEGLDPMGMAGSVLYICMCMHRMEIKQRDIAAASESTEVTIRNTAKTLKKNLHTFA